MNLVIFVQLFVSLVIQAHLTHGYGYDQAYDNGQQYVYKYVSQHLIGLPKSSDQYIVTQFHANISFNKVNGNQFIIFITSSRLLSWKQRVMMSDKYSILSTNKMNEKNLIDYERYNGTLEFPFSFIGKISEKIKEFMNYGNETRLSLNVKKAILNLINFRFNVTDEGKTINSYVNHYELNMEGMCPTEYTTVASPSATMKDTQNIKLRRIYSLNECIGLSYDFTNDFEYLSHGPQQQLESVKNINEIEMDLMRIGKENDSFFIWKSQSRSSYQLPSKGHNDDAPATYIVQDLTFLEKAQSTFKNLQLFLDVRSLEMDTLTANQQLSEIQRNVVLELFNKVKTDKLILQNLIQKLKMATEEDFRYWYEKVRNKNEINDIFKDIISDINTRESVNFFIDNLLDFYECDDIKMSMRISNLANFQSKNNDKIVLKLLKVVKSILTTGYQPCMYEGIKTLVLSLGSLAHNAVNNNFRNPATIKQIQGKMFQFYFNDFKYLMSKIIKSNETINLIFLKSLGNLGQIECFYFMKYTFRTTRSKLIKLQAINSLRKFYDVSDINSHSVTRFLMEIFLNMKENSEIRITAGQQIIIHNNNQMMLNNLILKLNNEPSQQVKGYLQELLIQMHMLCPYKIIYIKALKLLKMENFNDRTSYVTSYYEKNSELVFFYSSIYDTKSIDPVSNNLMILKRVQNSHFSEILELNLKYQNWENLKKPLFLSKPPKKQQLKDIINIKKYGNDVIIADFYNLLAFFKMNFKKSLSKLTPMELNIDLLCIASGELNLPAISGFDLKTTFLAINTMNLKVTFEITNELSKLKINSFVLVHHSLKFGINSKHFESNFEVNRKLIKYDNPELVVHLPTNKKKFKVELTPIKNVDYLLKFITTKELNINSDKVKERFPIFPKTIGTSKFQNVRNIKLKLPLGYSIVIQTTYVPNKVLVSNNLLNAGDCKVLIFFDCESKTSSKVTLAFEVDFPLNGFNILETIKSKNQVLYESRFIHAEFSHHSKSSMKYLVLLPKYSVDVVNNTVEIKKDELNLVNISGCLDIFIPRTKINHFIENNNNDDDTKVASINIIGKSSDNMAVFEHFNISLVHVTNDDINNARNVIQCIHDKFVHNLTHSLYCHRAQHHLLKFNKLAIATKYIVPNGPNNIISMTNLIHLIIPQDMLIKHGHWTPLSPFNSQITTKNNVDLLIETIAISNSLLVNLNYPHLQVYNYIPLSPRMFNRVLQMYNFMLKSERKNICTVNYNLNGVREIETFDSYIYRILKDLSINSVKESDKRLVLMEHVKQEIQIAQVFIEDSKQTIMEIKLSKFDKIIRISNDGNQIRVMIGKDEVSIPQSVTEQDRPIINIEESSKSKSYNKRMIDIHLLLSNVKVTTDQESIVRIEVAGNYFSQLTGVCGNFDGEIYNDAIPDNSGVMFTSSLHNKIPNIDGIYKYEYNYRLFDFYNMTK